MEFEIGAEEDASGANLHRLHAVISASIFEADDPADEVPEGCVVAELRVLGDPWSEPVARRAIGFLGPRRVGGWLAASRIEVLPSDVGPDLEPSPEDIALPLDQVLGERIAGSERNFEERRTLCWLFLGPQEEFEQWRESYPYAEACLIAVQRWLEGDFLEFGSALAASFPLDELWAYCLRRFSDRAKQVLRRRAAGDTLDTLGTEYGLSRERVRQIERTALEHLGRRIAILFTRRDPAMLALVGHARRLAAEVLVEASREHGVLLEATKERWISHALPPLEAEVLQTLLRVSKSPYVRRYFSAELKASIDPLSTAGWPFQEGRTALALRDADIDALRTAFANAAREREPRWARLDQICAAAKVSRERASFLVEFTELEILGDWLIDSDLSANDRRRVALNDILSSAGRAMGEAELFEEFVRLGFNTSSSLQDIHRALSEDPSGFVSDGSAIWQLRAQLGDAVEDRRPEHPQLPAAMSYEGLSHALEILGQSARGRTIETLEGISALAPDFALEAGNRLAATLAGLPEDERASLGQILDPAAEAKLAAWLGMAVPLEHGEDGGGARDGELPPRLLEALTVLAAFVAVIRSTCGSDDAHWQAVLNACGERARAWLFNTLNAPRRRVLSSFVEVATILRLRNTFSFLSDPWQTLLTLQAGLLRGDIGVLPRWLSSSQAPVAIRQLVAPGPNYSTSMACTWNALQAFRQGEIGRDAIETVARHSEWWPGWSVEEACRACKESLYQPPSARSVGPPATSGFVDLCDPDGSDDTSAASTGSAGVPTPRPSRFAWEAVLEPTGDAFAVGLPDSLDVSPGPIVLRGDGFRLGGSVGEDRTVQWHGGEPWVRLPPKGPSERRFNIERDGEIIASHTVRLWSADDYILGFRLGTGNGRAFDPFVSPLPRAGGIALLLHRSLTVSVEADKEYGLDADYILRLFRSGLPNGTTVSCGDEVLWEAEQQVESRRVIDDTTAFLTLGGGAAWAERTDLRLLRPIPGFEPHRVRVGAQSLPAQPDGTTWRFPGFALLPGIDNFRRRGRLDGLLDGERVSVPAQVSLAQAPPSAALRDAQRWRPLDPKLPFEKGAYGRARLWVSLPRLEGETKWTIFEGPRPVARYSEQGVQLGRKLLGFGEPLHLEPRWFNANGTGVAIADVVIDTGVVVGCDQEEQALRLRLALPIGVTERHRAFAWSERGITKLELAADDTSSSDLTIPVPGHPIDGVCLFHGDAWLGTWTLADDARAATSAFLARAPGWPETLRLAVMGHLPVLANGPAAAAAERMSVDGGKGLVTLFSMPRSAANEHVRDRLLETWEARPKLSAWIVGQFIRSVGARGGHVTLLDRMAADAPCSLPRLLVHGLDPVAAKERAGLVEKLIGRLLPQELIGELSCISGTEFRAEAEAAMLELARKATGFDDNFLAAKADASIASLAWAAAVSAKPARHDPNLATCLTIAPVRRWLAVHILSRLTSGIR